MKPRAALFLAAFVCAVTAFADEPLLVKMELEPAVTLPGIPVSIRFTAINRSAEAVEMPMTFALEATPPSGLLKIQPAPYSDLSTDSLPTEYAERLTIEPHGNKSFLLPTDGTMFIPAQLSVPALFTPGTYLIRAVLSDSLLREENRRKVFEAHSVDELRVFFPDLIVTNAAKLRVEQPKGEDLAAWNLILERSGGKGFSSLVGANEANRVAREIWDRFPNSKYVPATGGIVMPKDGETFEDRRRIMERIDPNNPVLDLYALGEAQSAALESGDSVNAGDLATGLRKAAFARQRLTDLAQRSKNDVVRILAAETEVWSDEFLYEMDRDRSSVQPPAPPNTKPIQAFVSCTKSKDHRVTIVFGYDNPNNFPVTYPIGDSNKFDSPLEDRRQPTTFLPGRYDSAVTIVIDEKVDKKEDEPLIAWIIGGTTGYATGNNDEPKCKE